MKTKCNNCCYPNIINSEACGCCEGVEILTPLSTYNRPGLSELAYRIGTHASFLETMKARLSSSDYPELVGLTTRDADDPSIALMDSWATVADVLTFYQERIANEGYLRTANERRSILELAQLVGYKLRPGVSSSVFLAYTIDENTKEEVKIPAGSGAQSIPGPDELPQVFETSEDIKVRESWNNLKPKLTRPQTKTSIENVSTKGNPNGPSESEPRLYLKGTSLNLKVGDPLLIDFGVGQPEFKRIYKISINDTSDYTLVYMKPLDLSGGTSLVEPLTMMEELIKSPSVHPQNTTRLVRGLREQFPVLSERKSKRPFAYGGYAAVNVLGALSSATREIFPKAMAESKVTESSGIHVFSFGIKANLFGYNAPKKTTINCTTGEVGISGDWDLSISDAGESIYLDAIYDSVLSNDWIVVQDPGSSISIRITNEPISITRSDYGLTVPTTKLNIGQTLITNMADLRSTSVYAQSELLELAEEPIETSIRGGKDQLIELDSFYDGLESGRWVVVNGEQIIPGTTGVRRSELTMISSVEQGVGRLLKDDGENFVESEVPGEQIRTFIKLSDELAYGFKRDTVTIYGNVVKATHGETRHEVLGSGDGSKVLQSFDLKQKPLTHVSASNPTGVDSTLKLFVNDIRWHEADTLADKQPTDRNFITQTDNENKASTIFGNGKKGSRLPTGIENIKTEYRAGIGKSGNVRAEQISLLQSKPLGVKEVINPLRASGGANREGRDQARKNAPLAVQALDRLVSVQDYEDFSRTYAGIGKAKATEITDGRRQLVHVTIAGSDDIPIDESSDLYRNLRQSLYKFGDPHQPIKLEVRELKLIVVSARIRILPDFQWEPIIIQVRDAMLNTFSFNRRELGQDVLLSEVISVMQSVRGVAYVDVDNFGGIPEKIKEGESRHLLTPDDIAESVDCLSSQWTHDDMETWCEEIKFDDIRCTKYSKCKKYGDVVKGLRQRLRVNLAGIEESVMHPAQLAFITSEVPETLIINQIE